MRMKPGKGLSLWDGSVFNTVRLSHFVILVPILNVNDNLYLAIYLNECEYLRLKSMVNNTWKLRDRPRDVENNLKPCNKGSVVSLYRHSTLHHLFVSQFLTSILTELPTYPCEDDATDLQHWHVGLLAFALLPYYGTDAVFGRVTCLQPWELILKKGAKKRIFNWLQWDNRTW